MSKAKTYVPSEFKAFYDLFQSVSRSHGKHYAFEDFLDLYIHAWCFNYPLNTELLQNRYTSEERQKFTLMMYEVIKILGEKIQDDSKWYDFFGTFYEFIGLSKQKNLSQFFTPMSVCDLMVQIAKSKTCKTFSDPCCGSGRFSLASNAISLGNFHFLVDLDFMCTKMAALNLMHHGIHGIVIADDSLYPKNNFKGAFVVNRTLLKTGVPQIEYINSAEQAYNYNNGFK
ncbi:N-6 DNA methylase [Kordia sp. TARA_039_SRF]|nr:N-6 DNA methylase [Kordia sp. TARA_039_SRF]